MDNFSKNCQTFIAIVTKAIGLCLLIISSCRKPPVARPFATEDLLLTAQDLPATWVMQGHYVVGCPSEKPCVRQVAPLPLSPEIATTWQRNGADGAREAVFAEFAPLAADDEDTVLIQGSQEILLFRLPTIAHSYYTSQIDVYQFSQSLVWEDLVSSTPFTSSYATEWRIGCSKGQSFKEKCLYYAVYEEFVVDFSFIIPNPDTVMNINQDEFIALVRMLDEKIGKLLYSDAAAEKTGSGISPTRTT